MENTRLMHKLKSTRADCGQSSLKRNITLVYIE